MPSLIKLDVSGNRICFIPNTFAQLISLEAFNFSDNNIELFPYFIGYLPNLKTLYCQRNPFQNIQITDVEGSSSNLLFVIRRYLEENPNKYSFEDETPVDDLLNSPILQKPNDTSEYSSTYLKGTVSNKYQPTKITSSLSETHIINEENHILLTDPSNLLKPLTLSFLYVCSNFP